MSLYGGIGLHANTSVIVLLNEQDKVIYRKRLSNELPAILEQLAPLRACAPDVEGGRVPGCWWTTPPTPPALAEARLAPFPQRGPPAALGAGAWDSPGACRFDGGWLPGSVGHRRPPWRRRPPQAWGAGAARLRLGVRPTLACRARGAARPEPPYCQGGAGAGAVGSRRSPTRPTRRGAGGGLAAPQQAGASGAPGGASWHAQGLGKGRAHASS